MHIRRLIHRTGLRERMPSFGQGSFALNTAFTSGKSVLTIVLQLLLTPVIVSLYEPSAYGAFSFIISVSTALLTICTLQYDRALFLAQDEAEIGTLRMASSLFPVAFSLLIALGLLFLRDPVLRSIDLEGMGNGIFMVPLLLALSGIAQTSQRMVAVRYKYREGFLFGTLNVIGAKLFAIGHGLLVSGSFLGLALSEVINKGLQWLLNERVILKEAPARVPRRGSLRQHLAVLRKYIAFPKYELPSTAILALANQIPVFWLPRAFGITILGQYALATSLMEMPMRLFGYSLAGTFYQKAARTYREEGSRSLGRITRRMMAWIAVVCLPALGLIAWQAEPVFTLVFGEEWAMAGTFASRLAVAYYFRLVVEPVLSVLRVLGEQRRFLLFHSNFLFVRVMAVGLAVHLGSDPVAAITYYALANALGHLVVAVYLLLRLRHAGAR